MLGYYRHLKKLIQVFVSGSMQYCEVYNYWTFFFWLIFILVWHEFMKQMFYRLQCSDFANFYCYTLSFFLLYKICNYVKTQHFEKKFPFIRFKDNSSFISPSNGSVAARILPGVKQNWYMYQSSTCIIGIYTTYNI